MSHKNQWLLSANPCHITTQWYRHSIGKLYTYNNHYMSGGKRGVILHYSFAFYRMKCLIFTCMSSNAHAHTNKSKVKCARSARSICFVQRFDAFSLFFPPFYDAFIVHQVQPDIFKSKYNCNNGTECASLTGLFDCSLGKYGFLFIQLYVYHVLRMYVWYVCVCVCVRYLLHTVHNNLSFA